MNKQYYGVIEEKVSDKDWLGADIILPRSPEGTNSFVKNGEIQYNQKDVHYNSCTIHGAIMAYSTLTGYEFTLKERKELWAKAIELGANPSIGWYIHSAIDLVRDYVNDNLDVKVSSYRVELGSFEHLMAMRLGYNVVCGYRGNKEFREDRNDNDIIDDVKLDTPTTYGHCLSCVYSIGDEYDNVIDNYYPRKNNIYRVPTAHWKELVKNKVFFKWGYIYLVKQK